MKNKASQNEREILAKTELNYNYCLYLKGGLLIGLQLICILLLLFTKLLNYKSSATIVGISGFNAINSIFFGGKLGFIEFGKLIYIDVPWFARAIVIATLFILVTAIFVRAFRTFLLKKDSAALGYVEITFGVILILFYIICLVSENVKALIANGEQAIFYKLELSIITAFIGLLMIVTGLLQAFCKLAIFPKIKKYAIFYVLLIIPTVLILIFNIYPSVLQTILSFKNYKLSDGIWGSDWVGLENFKYMVLNSKMLMIIWQTLYLSFLRLVAGIIPAVFFALVFFHITSKKYRSVVQTIVYIPHFFSWVVIYAIITAFLTPDGIVNNILVNVFQREKIDFLSEPRLFYLNMILSSIWKEVGWGTILFMASLMGIDKTLYEAANIDGAGVFAKLRHITLPGLVPIIVFQTVMAVGNLLRGAGGEQVLLFSTGAVRENKALVIDTWLYWEGLQELKYGLSSAVSFAQSVIGFLMVYGAHKLSQKLVGIGAW